MLLRASSRYFERGIFMKKKYVNFTAALAAAFLCSGTGSVLAAGVTLEVTDPSQITSGGDWQENENQIYAPGGPGLSGGNQLHLSGEGTWPRLAGGFGIGAADNTVNVDQASGLSHMYGGYTASAYSGANRNTLNLNGAAFSGSGGTISGGYAAVANNGSSAAADNNAVNLSDVTIGSSYKVYGGHSNLFSGEAAANENAVDMTGGTIGASGYVYGGHVQVGSGSAVTNRNAVSLTGVNAQSSSYIYGGSAGNGGEGSAEANGNAVSLNGATMGKAKIWGGMSNVTGSWGSVSDGTYAETTGNTVSLTNVTLGVSEINGGKASAYLSGNAAANRNVVSLENVTLGKGSKVYGGYVFAAGDAAASENTVHIYGSLSAEDAPAAVYGGYADGGGEVQDNKIILHDGADAAVYADLYGSNGTGDGYTGNALVLDNWSGTVNSVQNFDEVTFRNIRWQTGGTVLNITDNTQENSLENTTVKVEQLSMAGGTALYAGDTMTLIQSNKDTGIDLDKVDVTKVSEFTAGVTAVGTGSAEMDSGNQLVYKVTNIARSGQTDLVGESRLAGAAFVNQGADIAADSLWLLDDGYHFGTQTFGAVYGNRSTYDVASDIKINGWSEIAGFGNIHEVKNGRLAWGVFYEKGTGNYRTWNTFNNEMFRGDGSLLYNGGGAAVRLTKDSGMYYEASLRAGTLSSSMSNAVKDGNGNSYGFDSDSTYWGAHIGAGKLIQRGSGQWDIYGKYFHTDIDGDSFEMGGDRFSFDDVTSDRLRLGARYTADTDKAWSLYCGAAYEYEFSGDSRMKAGQFEAPEQSLQGSTVFGEIGTVWGRKDSPWSMDVNLRGYAGEREGFSGMVQLAYAF